MKKNLTLMVCLLLLLGVAKVSAAYTTPQSGKVYRIHNGKNEKVIGEDGIARELVSIDAAANDFKGTTLKTFKFDVNEKNRYVITFYTADAPWADLVVGQAALLRKGNVSSIDEMEGDNPIVKVEYYNMAGLCVEPSTPGMYIRKNIYKNGTFKGNVVVIK